MNSAELQTRRRDHPVILSRKESTLVLPYIIGRNEARVAFVPQQARVRIRHLNGRGPSPFARSAMTEQGKERAR